MLNTFQYNHLDIALGVIEAVCTIKANQVTVCHYIISSFPAQHFKMMEFCHDKYGVTKTARTSKLCV